MNKIEKMIKEMCPNGVEYKRIWELTAWDKLFNNMDRTMQKKVIKYPYLLANDMFALEIEGGNVKLLSTGNREGWTTEELAGDNLCEGEVVAMPWGGTPNIKYYKGKFVTADNRIATSLNTDILSNKFLYYVMQNRLDEISSFYRGSGIKHPDMYKVLTMEIPVPPIEVQSEIVRILDNFTELTAELTARNKQYEYYRGKLLNGEKIGSKTYKTRKSKLGEIVQFRNGKGHEKCITDDGKYIVVNSKFVSTEGMVKKYSNEQLTPLYENEIAMVMSDLPNGRALAKCFFVNENDKYTLNQRICALKSIDKDVHEKYLYYLLNRNIGLLKYDNGVDQTNLSKENILNLELNIPDLKIQNRIVNALENFDSICKDLNIGLPAEIEARKKQYEYYRDALLNFAETGNVDFVERERERITL